MHWALGLVAAAGAIELDLNDKDSVNSAGKVIADGVLDYYDGSHYGGTVGVMSPPYYWWESASAFNGIYTYSLISGDSEYDDILYDSLMAQAGDGWDFITKNQSNVEGNDDQGYWAIFAMEAAERGFRSPGNGKKWVDMAKNVFDEMTTRWDPQCGGGLRWQIFDWNHGFEYKNTVSTGCMFNLAARLARYTNNQTYADWAYKIYDWMVAVEFLVEPSPKSVYHIYDGAGTETNCTEKSLAEWSYNYGLFLSGMSYLHDALGGNTWSDRIDMAWKRSANIFFKHDDTNAMIEPSCQPQGTCNNDQRSFRASFARFLGHLMIFLPEYQDQVLPLLQDNANNVAKSCSGGKDGRTCGQDWSKGSWDGVYGLGEEMSALDVIMSTRVTSLGKPGTGHDVDGVLAVPVGQGESSSSSSSSTTSSSSSTSSTSSSTSTTPTTTSTSTTPTPTTSSTSSSSSSEEPTTSSSSTESSTSIVPPTTSQMSSTEQSTEQSTNSTTQFTTTTAANSTSSEDTTTSVVTTSSTSAEPSTTDEPASTSHAAATSSNFAAIAAVPGTILSILMVFVL